MDQLLIFEQLLPPAEFNQIGPYLRTKQGYLFAHTSLPGEDKVFWSTRLDNALFRQQLPELLKSRLNCDFEVVRAYSSALTFGLDSSFHVDTGNNATHTILWYVHEEWDKEWGGHTEFLVDNKHYYVYPQPNQFILFPAHVLHRGLPPTRSCHRLRQVVAWKIIMKR